MDDDGGVGVVVAAVEQGGVGVDSANLFSVEEVVHWRRAVYEIEISWKMGAFAPFVTKRNSQSKMEVGMPMALAFFHKARACSTSSMRMHQRSRPQLW